MANTDQLLAAAKAAHDAGRFAEAEGLFRQVLAIEPRHVRALHGLGFVAQRAGQNELAIRLMEQAIAADPAAAESYNNLGMVLREAGESGGAARSFIKALSVRPEFCEAWFNLAGTLARQGHGDAAIQCYRQVMGIRPDFAEARERMNALLTARAEVTSQRPPHPALSPEYRGEGREGKEGTKQRGEHSAILGSLGKLLADLGRIDEAIVCHRRAIELDPRRPEAHHDMALALRHTPRVEETEACLRRAIELRPNYASAHNNLGNTLRSQWRLAEGIEEIRKALTIRPDNGQIHSNLLADLHYDAGIERQEIFAEHVRWNQRQASHLSSDIRPHTNQRDQRRRLRVGYISPDLRQHSVAFFIEPILASHDHGQFEVFCYSNVQRPDAVTDRCRSAADVWREVTGRADEQVAEMIRADGIDILVDLAGHTGDNRLLVLARRPAPVQVTYLGYQDTTGLSTVDYRFTDAICDPPGESDRYYTEQLLRLPDTFACYLPPQIAPEVGPLPALRAGHVTFASFGRLEKVSEAMLRLWAAVLRQVQNSRLLIRAHGLENASVRRRLLTVLESEGIHASRVELAGAGDFLQYLRGHDQVDVVLDTFPFNGHTTTCHGLWMGVPIVSLAGRNFASRMGLSVLTNLRLRELAADSPQQYVEAAAKLAADLPRLAELRAEMRQRMQSSPIMNAARLTGELERAYREMWGKWCARVSAD